MRHPLSPRLARPLAPLVVALAVASGCATHGPGPLRMPDPALERCEAQQAARLRFLERRLDARDPAPAAVRERVGGSLADHVAVAVGRSERARPSVDRARVGRRREEPSGRWHGDVAGHRTHQ